MHEDGFAYSFDPNACDACGGNCCTGESGAIYLNMQEMENIAEFLGLSIEAFAMEHLIKKGYKFSIKERIVESSYDCHFFDREKKGCSIYPVRPTQCRTFPFWSYFTTHHDELAQECPGVQFHDQKESNV